MGDEEDVVAFWEGPEGQERLKEIEELKELIQEREELEKALEREEREGRVGSSKEDGMKEREERLRELLAQKAQEQAARLKKAQDLFQLGQRAYGRGVYHKAVEILEAALSFVGPGTTLGGEIQLWLAMAYDANQQRGDCLALYRKLEETHPNSKIRKQAAYMRYIAEAPKIKLTPEEILTVPVLDKNNNSSDRTWSQMVRETRKARTPRKLKKPDSRDYMDDLMSWKPPPRWERSPYFWVALSVWLTLVGIALVFQD